MNGIKHFTAESTDLYNASSLKEQSVNGSLIYLRNIGVARWAWGPRPLPINVM